MAPPPAQHFSEAEELRKATTFHPSLWGDFFLTYQPPTAPQVINNCISLKIIIRG